MNLEELKDKTLQLSPEERAYLAHALLASLDTMNQDEIDKLWLREAILRDEELENGTAHASPAHEVFARY